MLSRANRKARKIKSKNWERKVRFTNESKKETKEKERERERERERDTRRDRFTCIRHNCEFHVINGKAQAFIIEVMKDDG